MRRELRVDGHRDQGARLGALDGARVLECPGEQCGARYPVFDGIPFIFSDPDSYEIPSGAPIDLAAMHGGACAAALGNQSQKGVMNLLARRIAGLAWASFRDWMTPVPEAPEVESAIHAVEVMSWLRSLGEADTVGDGVRMVLGAGLGREAWEAASGTTILAEAHAPSLMIARRLLREGEVSLPIPVDAHRWQEVHLRVPQAARVKAAMICCDIHNPPFEAESATSVVATNVVDSVSNPYLMLSQAHALVSPGGLLSLTTPFAWSEDITPRASWLSALDDRADAKDADVLEWLLTSQLNPSMRVVARRRFSWFMRASDSQGSAFRSHGWCFAG